MQKQSSLTAAALHFLTGGATTHIVQNIATRTGIRNKRIAQSVADHFASGMKGVHDNSLKAKFLSGVRGTLAPDLEILHHEAWNAGNKLGPVLDKVGPRAKAGLRMLAEGRTDRFNKLKSRMRFDTETVQKLDAAQNHVSVRAALKASPETASKMKALFSDKNTPLLSNITRNIGRGKLPKVQAPGAPSTKLPALVGTGVGIAAGDFATAGVNAIKNSSMIDAVKNNKYLSKGVNKLHGLIVHHPLEKGYANPGRDFVHGLKNRVMEFGWSPVSQTLKHTSSQVAKNLEEGHVNSSKLLTRARGLLQAKERSTV